MDIEGLCDRCVHFAVCGNKNTERSKVCWHRDYVVIQTDMLKSHKEDEECLDAIKNHLAFLIGHNMIGVISTSNYFRGHFFNIILTAKQKVTNPDLRKDS